MNTKTLPKISMITASFVSFLALSAASNAAVLITFTEEGGDVLMRTSGTVDVTNAVFNRDDVTAGGTQGSSATWGVNFYEPHTIFEWSRGVDLLPGQLTNAFFVGAVESVAGGFRIDGANFSSNNAGDASLTNNDAKDATVTSVSGVVRFSSQSFASMGLDNHTLNTNHGLWAARSGASDSETVYFKVSSVPEPTSFVLLATGLLSFSARRRRNL